MRVQQHPCSGWKLDVVMVQGVKIFMNALRTFTNLRDVPIKVTEFPSSGPGPEQAASLPQPTVQNDLVSIHPVVLSAHQVGMQLSRFMDRRMSWACSRRSGIYIRNLVRGWQGSSSVLISGLWPIDREESCCSLLCTLKDVRNRSVARGSDVAQLPSRCGMFDQECHAISYACAADPSAPRF